jgi:hypothetical protein
MQGYATAGTERQPRPHKHVVLVDGKCIYSGNDWDEAIRLFLEAGKQKDVRWVEHRVDGRQAALWGYIS